MHGASVLIEQAFLFMNQIKTKLRNRLSDWLLNELLFLKRFGYKDWFKMPWRRIVAFFNNLTNFASMPWMQQRLKVKQEKQKQKKKNFI